MRPTASWRSRRAWAGDHRSRRRSCSSIEVVHEADLLYRGQSHVFRVPVPASGFDGAAIAALLAERYKARFAIELPEITPVLANLRTTVFGRRKAIDLALLRARARAGSGGASDKEPVRFDGSFVDTPVYARDALAQGATISGPAIVQQADATVVVRREGGGRPARQPRRRRLSITATQRFDRCRLTPSRSPSSRTA